MEVSIAKRPFEHILWPEVFKSLITCWEVFKPYKNLLGDFYRLHCCACAEAIAVYVKDFEIFCCPHFEEKK